MLVKAEPLLAVAGEMQSQDGVTHLVAQRIWVPRLQGERPPSGGSRDFH